MNTCNDGKIQSDKMCQNVSRSNSSKRPFSKGRAARSTERPNRSNSLDRSPSVAGPVVKFQPQVEVDQSCQTDVPDSDYYCFDDDRTEEQIQPNQVHRCCRPFVSITKCKSLSYFCLILEKGNHSWSRT